MANYLIRSCDNRTEYVVDPNGNTIVTGTTYYFTFTGETLPICGTVISEDSNPIVDGILLATDSLDCLDCLQKNNFSFLVTGCTTGTGGGPVVATDFTEFPLGFYYTLCPPPEFDFLGCQCFYVYDIEPTTVIFTFENYGPFTSCSCESPRSANTESNICLEICTESGTTVVSVTPPHPIWTDGYGTQVTELNMITLGGMNGLNN